MSDFLAAMAEASLERARQVDASALETKLETVDPPKALDVGGPGFDVIAEAKLASPAVGRLSEGGAGRVGELAVSYASAGAAAVSVLTEEARFDGALEHLEQTVPMVDVPVMRKDFLVHPVQVTEARAAGASGVLLIARMLPGDLLEEMTDLTLELGMFALVEIFDRDDLETAFRVFDRDVLVGVNCRDLATLEVEFDRFETLAPHLPDHLPTVAESGIGDPEHASAVADLGYRLALVGSSLVANPDPGALLSALIDTGRRQLAKVGE